MKAMILAGGMSTRLYPLTKQVPKPLVPVAGIPNAVHLIAYLKQYGCTEIAINVHYLADQITERLGDGSAYGVHLTYLHEEVLLGSAGAVKQMEEFLKDDDFVVVGCDDLTNLPLDELLAFHKRNDAIATIGLVERDEVDQYGVVVTDPGGRITGFQEKPAKGTERSKLANTGIYAFTPKIFDYIPADTFYDFGKNVFAELQQTQAPFYGFDARGAYWCDIGTIPEYRRATADVVEGRFKLPDDSGPAIDPAAKIAASVAIDGHVIVRAGAVIEDFAVLVGPCAIDAGVRIGAGAHIERSILWEGATVGARARLNDAVVGARYTVLPDSNVDGIVVANEETAPLS